MDNETTIEYNERVQELFLRYLVTDPDLWMRTRTIIEINYFHVTLRPVIRLMKEYSEQHNGLPRIEQIEALTNIKIEPMENLSEIDKDWFMVNIEAFCKRRAIQEWLTKGPEYVKDSNYGQLEQGLKDALLISLYKNLGTDYYASPKERLELLRDQRGGISSGLRDFDQFLEGGMNFGELHIWAGGSGSGKSIWLQNLALNFANQGLNVVYMTLELGEEMIGQRVDAMITGFKTSEVLRRIDDVDVIVKRHGKHSGNIMLKEIPSESCVNDVKAYLKELEIQMGLRPDVLVIDYMDLIAPNDKRIDVSNLHIKDKFVAQELRAMARDGLGPDHKLLCISASQLNRQAVEAETHNHSHIAGGKSKVDAADGMYSIHTSAAMREKGMYKLQVMKSRTSAGVDRIIPFGYNVESMRISDFDGELADLHEDEVDIFDQIAGNNNISGISSAATSAVTPTVPVSTPTPPESASDMLRKIRGDDDI